MNPSRKRFRHSAKTTTTYDNNDNDSDSDSSSSHDSSPNYNVEDDEEHVCHLLSYLSVSGAFLLECGLGYQSESESSGDDQAKSKHGMTRRGVRYLEEDHQFIDDSEACDPGFYFSKHRFAVPVWLLC